MNFFFPVSLALHTFFPRQYPVRLGPCSLCSSLKCNAAGRLSGTVPPKQSSALALAARPFHTLLLFPQLTRDTFSLALCGLMSKK